jgi:hypothetical protein
LRAGDKLSSVISISRAGDLKSLVKYSKMSQDEYSYHLPGQLEINSED